MTLSDFCVCLRCGLVRGPGPWLANSDDISRQLTCSVCDPWPDDRGMLTQSNVGDFLCAGLRALVRGARS